MTETSPESSGEYANEGRGSVDRSLHAIPEEFERGTKAWFSAASRSLGRASHSLLASIEYVTMDELPDDSVTGTPYGNSENVSLYKSINFKSEWIIPLDETLNFDLDSFLTRLYTMSEEHAAHVTKGIIHQISTTTVEHGRIVDGSDRPFFDVYCEALDKLEFSFDEEGNHNLGLIVNPETAEQMPPFTPEQERVIERIIQLKRDEWNAKRRSRKLPKFLN